jgi:hypothetical protein
MERGGCAPSPEPLPRLGTQEVNVMWLSIIWGVLAIVFLALGCFQWKMAGKSIAHLKIQQYIMEGLEITVNMAGVDFNELISHFNNYIDYYNKTSKSQNKTQAIGYWVASLTALLSLVVTLVI